MMTINEIWRLLEIDNSQGSGILLRRCPSTVIPDVFAAIRNPEKQRSIILKTKYSKLPDITHFEKLKDISLKIISNGNENITFSLELSLLNPEHKDVFAVFCDDLISSISDIEDDKRVITEFLNKLEKWSLLFEKASLSGLSIEQQIGLYGELYFLRKWITASQNIPKCVKAWLGPEKECRDFQLNNWGLEVKTSQGKGHQKVQISSERQLDTNTLDFLFLFHLTVDLQLQNGENLNQIVESIADMMSGDYVVLNDFRTKLFHVGYFKHHSSLYSNTGYQIRNQSYYKVGGAFPRIEEGELRQGVADVKYTITISECASHLMEECTVLEIIN